MHNKQACLWLVIILLSACGSKKESAAVSIKDQARINQLLSKNTCSTCHKRDKKLVGPSFQEIAGRKHSADRLVELIKNPEPENWPDYPVPMVGLSHLDHDELMEIAQWITTLE